MDVTKKHLDESDESKTSTSEVQVASLRPHLFFNLVNLFLNPQHAKWVRLTPLSHMIRVHI